MDKPLPEIQDKFDTESAQEIVDAGYPANADHLDELIFWSCFPNDPVCWITHPYVRDLGDEILAKPLAEFLEFNARVGQMELAVDAFNFFIDCRGQTFRTEVFAQLENPEVKKLFDEPGESPSKC